ncbi:MAG: hypothetical protein IPF92_06525 [Myxococcales bacterium]|nr:hypothetical protein [Myxococcales bacterium]MBL0192699.1 hypothetical protein [Myxococcales bacterium]HQY62687.1 hypothetical protein [Polyangiaceae bacterium]
MRSPLPSLRSVTRLTALTALAAAGLLAACVGTDPVPGGGTPNPSATTTTTSTTTGTTPGTDASLPDGAAPDASLPDGAAPDGAAPDAADAAPPPPAPPVVSPNVWLDARKIPATTTTLRTWTDSTANGANATSLAALTFSPTAVGGRPGVVFVGDASQALSIPAAKVPPFRAFAGAGYAVFMVAAYKDTAARTAQAVLFARRASTGIFPALERVGLQLTMNNTLTEVAAELTSFSGTQVTVEAKAATPTKTAPHLYVVHGVGGAVTLRVDGAVVQTASGFVENNFPTNADLPLDIGAYTSTTAAQFGLVGAIGLVAVYTRPLSVAEVAAGEAATKAAWGIP